MQYCVQPGELSVKTVNYSKTAVTANLGFHNFECLVHMSLVENTVCYDEFKKYVKSLSLRHYQSVHLTEVHHRLHHSGFTQAHFNNYLVVMHQKYIII